MRILLLPAALAALAASPACAGQVQTPECRRDLLVAESNVRTAREKLLASEEAPIARRCTVWREHIRSSKASSAVFQRGLTDTEKRVKTAEMASTIADFEEAVAGSCKGK